MLKRFKRKAFTFINMSEVFISHVKLIDCDDLTKELIDLIQKVKLKLRNRTYIKICNITWYLKYVRIEFRLLKYVKCGDTVKALKLVTYGLTDLNSSLNR